VFIDYPAEDDEQQMVKQITDGRVGDQLDTSAIWPMMKADEIPQIQNHIASLKVDDEIINYAVRLIRAARDWNGIEAGPGPRGTISLLRTARAEAFLNDREFVTPDDIKRAAVPVLRHRIRLTTDLEIEGYRTDDVLKDLLDNLPAPRQ
jgi:MoxR-like ATPase